MYKIPCVFLMPLLIWYRYSSYFFKKLLKRGINMHVKHFLFFCIKMSSKVHFGQLFTFVHGRSFQTIFYSRFYPILLIILKIIGYSELELSINERCKVDGGFYAVHVFYSIINAKSKGKNLICRNCYTIGNVIGNPIRTISL